MVVTERISIRTKGECDIIDITGDVERVVSQSGIESGTVTVFISGSTAGLTTIEYEPGVVADFKAMWDRIVPRDIQYRHDQRWGDGNGYSHVRASTLGPSLVVPFFGRSLLLGTWQQIIVVDFDNRPRSREIVLQIVGE
ncbi:MAG: secondary thiamine-phosphate synthase enzyme YjbQ [Chloroflexota bacterium]|nr:secondary thiamine-phosphate synthase enzyme YjbQ [Chloroflexota bacterium]